MAYTRESKDMDPEEIIESKEKYATIHCLPEEDTVHEEKSYKSTFDEKFPQKISEQIESF